MYTIITFYKFQKLSDIHTIKNTLDTLCHNIKGTILLAEEGINATVAGAQGDIDQLVTYLKQTFPDILFKFSFAEKMPFYRMKVKIKNEIVTLRQKEADVEKTTGDYVKPKAWNALMQDPNVIIIDTRNDYEYALGTFRNAINPNTQSFAQFPDFVENYLTNKDQPIAMFCTGGIRCEKASSYLKAIGYNKVYQLDGGILKYLEEMPEEDSLWEGECFIFDQRVSLKHKVEQGQFALCHGCRHTLSADDIASDVYEKGVSCPHCFHKTTDIQKKCFRDRQKQMELSVVRGECHIGPR